LKVFLTMNKSPSLITKENIQEIFPLTPLQAGMLYQLEMQPDSRAYSIQTRYSIQGNFDCSQCCKTWDILVARHDCLRTAFVYKNEGPPLQLVLKNRPIDFLYEDLRSFSSDQQEPYIQECCRRDRERGFDFRNDSLVRVRVYQLDESRFEMVWIYSHLILDGWSGSILQNEFIEVYRCLRNAESIVLPEQPSYHHYLDSLETKDGLAANRVWTNYLEGVEAVCSVPSLRKGKPHESYQLSIHTFQLDEDLTRRISRYAGEHRVTVNTVLKCVWGLVLGYYNHTGDVVFGTVVSGRPPEISGIEHSTGMFINTIPVRIRCHEQEPFSALLQTVQGEAFALAPYDFYALSDMQSLFGQKRVLFDHLFVFENFPAIDDIDESAMRDMLGFVVTGVHSEEQAQYDFGLVVVPGKKLIFHLHHNEWVYGQDEMARIEGHIRTCMDAVLLNPDIPIRDVSFLTDEEFRLVTQTLSSCTCSEITETIVSLWDHQVAQSPEQIAVLDGDKHIAYRLLDEHANRLAQALMLHPVIDHGSFMAVLLPSGFERILALLAILKAGCVYVPIDPAYPPDRIHYMLEDSGCCLVLTTAALKNQINLPDHRYYNIHDVLPENSSAPVCAITSRDLAYVIYTSGSTGNPKGVLLEHGGFVNMIQEQIRLFGIASDDRILQFASCAFDASLSEIFLALLSGSSVVVCPEAIRNEPTAFLDFIKKNRITVLTLPPSFLRSLDRDDLSPLRVLITAGEAVNPGDALFYADSLSFFNAYGPTENSVCATIQPVRPDCAYPHGIPIGSPLNNMYVRILDSWLRPMPVGMPGELCIGGVSVARGYHNKPDLTAQAFIIDPLECNARIYRSGDMARWLPDGTLDFMGRKDWQIKIRGHRIELGEVAFRLKQHPKVQDVVVLPTEEHDDLIAYVVGHFEEGEVDFKSFLSSSLPGYMIPRTVVAVDQIPLTQNGKVDTQALVCLGDQKRGAGKTVFVPRDDREQQFEAVIKEVLQIDEIYQDSSFVELGGNSLKSIHVCNKLRKRGIDIPLKRMVDSLTIGEVIRKGDVSLRGTSPSAFSGSAPLTPIQAWFFDRPVESCRQCNHIFTFKNPDGFNPEALRLAWRALLSHHDALRLRFRRDGQVVVQEIDVLRSEIQMDIITLENDEAGADTVKLILDARYQLFDLEQGPLYKTVLFQSHHEQFFCIVLHHLVTDAVSWSFLLDDLKQAYTDAVEGRPIALARKTSAYLAYARQLHSLAIQGAFDQEVGFWQSIEEKDTPYLCQRNCAETSRHDETLIYRLDCTEEETSALLASCTRPQEYELYDVLLAALASGLSATINDSEIRIMLTGHGRNPITDDVDVSRTVGWFTSNFPFLLPLRGSVLDIRQRRREIPSHGLGYGALKYGDTNRHSPKISFAGFPQISFNYMGEMMPSMNIGPFEVVPELTYVSLSDEFCYSQMVEIEAMILSGCLQMGFRYHDPEVSAEWIEQLAKKTKEFLRSYARIHQKK
jgi:amino acid adenylation domain-containing protein/non-ribosomal peptide synthase protein (TIGR01720 family)